MKVVITESFRYAIAGYDVREFVADKEPQDVPDEVGEWAIENKHGSLPKEGAKK